MPGTQKITTERTEYTEKEESDTLTGDIIKWNCSNSRSSIVVVFKPKLPPIR